MNDRADLRQRILPFDDLEAAPPERAARAASDAPSNAPGQPRRSRRGQTRKCGQHTWLMVEFLPGRYKLRCTSCGTRGPSLRSAT